MCFQSVKFNDFDDKAMRWLCILIYTYIFKYDYDMSFNLLMMLHSTTGPYERPVIDVVYGETIFYSTKAVWEMVARKEWLRYRHDASPMFDLPGSKPVWAPYILFF